MPADIVDETSLEPALVEVAEHACDAILAAAGQSQCELSVVLVGDGRMRELNLEWRGKDSTTDVLSFSQRETGAGETPDDAMPGAGGAGCETMLGDVVVSVDTLRRQAVEGGWSEAEELVRLLLHGVLHLVGYDHEQEDDAARMRAEEGRIVGELAARGIACAWEGQS